MTTAEIQAWAPSVFFLLGALAMFLAGPFWFVAFVASDNPYDSSTWRRPAFIGTTLFVIGAVTIATVWGVS